MIRTTKVLLSLLGIGTIGSGGSYVAYSFSDSLFPNRNKRIIKPQSTFVDSQGTQGLEESLSKGESTLVYEYLKIDGDEKKCVKSIKSNKEEIKQQDFQLENCSGWETKDLDTNQKVIWVKTDYESVNTLLGTWLVLGNEKDFKKDNSQENRELSAQGDDSIVFACNKNSMEGNKLEVKCLQKKESNLLSQ
ncbi:hypothetical protein MSUIS_00460 [Mycoplasma suis KI3806]|uniref:Uncharacterized protein n=1 Tax=Mycoplasma suis (strain KI_3806) TaxID=708248 RepID=F0V2R7_MYCS3|nr:hypothetical protein [Mycoplasma suis]CBZ40139.1 hypothetical protein MSUIS_00460 [Mycoplasma suis KI3806]